MIWFLMVRYLLLYRFFIGARLCSVCGRRCSVRSSATCLRRCVHGWSGRRGIFFPYMGGGVVYGSALHSYRRFLRVGLSQLFCVARAVSFYFFLAMCIPAMQRPGVNSFSEFNKASFIGKK